MQGNALFKERGAANLSGGAIVSAGFFGKTIKCFSEPLAEVYPNKPIHTMNIMYHADKIKDKDDDGGCHKDYNESPTITGGLTHITCMHSITKEFTALNRGESPLLV